METTVTGLHFLADNLNGRKLMHFLCYSLPPLLENLPTITRQRMCLQLVGAPAHFTYSERQYFPRYMFPR